ncbi:hypothetical protein Tco_1310870 [Tanacetum coccineum]
MALHMLRDLWKDALPSPVHETEMLEICLPLRKRPHRTTPGPGCEVGESSAAGAARQLGYGITDTWDDLVGAIQEIAPTTLEGSARVTELVTTVDQEDGSSISQLMIHDMSPRELLLSARVKHVITSDTVMSQAVRDHLSCTAAGPDSDDRSFRASRDLLRDPAEPELTRGGHTERPEMTLDKPLPRELGAQKETITCGRLDPVVYEDGNVFRIRNCTWRINVKFATCTFWELLYRWTHIDRRIYFGWRQTENKRKFEDTPRNNQNQQQNKRPKNTEAGLYCRERRQENRMKGTISHLDVPKCNLTITVLVYQHALNCKKLGPPDPWTDPRHLLEIPDQLPLSERKSVVKLFKVRTG